MSLSRKPSPPNPISVLLRDTWLSFLPESVRAIHRPSSTVTMIRATMLTGILQFMLFAMLAVLRFIAFASLRQQQWSPVLGRASDAVKVTGMLVITLEFLMQPISLILIYFSMEGLTRFISAFILEHPLATLPAFLIVKIQARRREKQAREHAKQLPPDKVEISADGECVRVASCLPKPTWNSSITIGIQGQWYRVEKEEKGADPHTFIYVLKRAPIGRILRAYEEYEIDKPLQISP